MIACVQDLRRCFSFILLGCLTAMASGCAGQLQKSTVFAPPGSTNLVVQADTLNMRRCPDTTCPVIALLYQGETVAVRRVSGDWSEIERRQGGIGWVASKYLGGQHFGAGKATNTAAPAQPEEELAGPLTAPPPEITDELAQPGMATDPASPPEISEEFGQ